ncbi:hypothetical protein SAMN05421636_106375 [Pricia antarctica]|uniref:Uncharacterized protein n=1 Tax=Pricia antarctica TaxID=641691 RepID=A0A1G7EYI6_9FLAO|nr:hypothetical protein SAMN05421636_106375 [Pricia antarctica]
MKYSFKDTIISLFRRIDKTIFDLHRTGTAWKNRKVPHWIVLVFAIGSYFLLLWQLWPFLSNPQISFFGYLGSFFLLVFTILFLVFAKIYISRLLNYTSPYPIQNKKSHIAKAISRYLSAIPKQPIALIMIGPIFLRTI